MQTFDRSLVDACLDAVRCWHDGDAGAGLSRAVLRLNHILGSTQVAIVVVERHQPRAIAQAGAPAALTLDAAVRAFDTGIAVPPVTRGRPAEAAWPVRYGATVVGAIWCRWSNGTSLSEDVLAAVLDLTAAAAAPFVHEARERELRPGTIETIAPDLVGDSRAIQGVRQAVQRAAASPFPVLIEGESGAGKELVARAVHAASVRRSARFCALNCAALADDLVEAELFGHARGAFTGAVVERAGLFEASQAGTLFLDEVAELSSRVQAKLLRTLQEGEVRRLGESATRKVDARIVAATNRPLNGEVTAGRFRNDLRYRLDVLRISIPPLRERIEDLPPLVRHVWSALARRTGSRAVLSPAAMTRLGQYDWPGNVRELQNVLAAAMVAGPKRGVIGPHALPPHISHASSAAGKATLAAARRDFEARYVRAALARSGGRAAVAARELGVSRQGLAKLATRLGIAPLARAHDALE